MNIGIVIATNDAETCWNALRYANYCLGQKEDVKIFFLGKGVEYQSVGTEKFDTVDQAKKFVSSGGKVFACGTCITSRGMEGSGLCPVNTMKDMYDIVRESDRLLTF